MSNFVGAIFALFTYIAVGGPIGYDLDPLTSQLQTFLSDKGSPMPAVEVTKYDNWRTIVAISAAESSYCKHMAGSYNCWGIKDYRKGSDRFGKTRNFCISMTPGMVSLALGEWSDDGSMLSPCILGSIMSLMRCTTSSAM